MSSARDGFSTYPQISAKPYKYRRLAAFSEFCAGAQVACIQPSPNSHLNSVLLAIWRVAGSPGILGAGNLPVRLHLSGATAASTTP